MTQTNNVHAPDVGDDHVPRAGMLLADPLVTSGTHVGGSRWVRRIAMLAASLLLLAVVAWMVGSQALVAGWAAVTPSTILAALLLGLVATAAQAWRWRTLAGHRGLVVSRRRALGDCYVSTLGNMLLPGGLGGDAARVAVYRDRGNRRWVSPLLALGAERLSATTLLFAVASVSFFSRSAPLALAAATLALLCLAASLWCLHGLCALQSLLVWISSAVGVGALVGLYLVAMSSFGGPVVPVVAVVGLASMSIPLGVGGWGVRELSVGVLASTLGVTGSYAVETATAYGLLATISCLPGVAVLLLRLPRSGRRTREAAPRRSATQLAAGRG